jgi:hypothetical protein
MRIIEGRKKKSQSQGYSGCVCVGGIQQKKKKGVDDVGLMFEAHGGGGCLYFCFLFGKKSAITLRCRGASSL